MCHADKPIQLDQRDYAVVGDKVFRYRSLELPSGHVGGAPTELECLGIHPVGFVAPFASNRAVINGQVRALHTLGGLS